MKDIYERLIELLDYSYSPYSGFRVASIAVSKGGERFEGVNVESASYSLTICAERSALFRAISAGVEAGEIEEVHILAKRNATELTAVTPCGSCRQVIYELSAGKCDIHIYGQDGKSRVVTIERLLPDSFTM
jgi:cytidine deaminase